MTLTRELVVRESGDVPDLITNPVTGELVPITAATDELGGVVDGLKELESAAKEARELVNGELLKRMDADATWTAAVGPFKISAPSPTAGTKGYDPDRLRTNLLKLEARGKVSMAAVDAAVERVIPDPYNLAKKDGINRLRKLEDPEINAAIDDAAVTTQAPKRTVKVERVKAKTA